jgi:hypothetical protein
MHTNVSDLSPLAKLATIRVLSLDNTKVVSVHPIRGLMKLEIIYLTDCVIRDKSLFKDENISYLEFLFGKKELIFPKSVFMVADISVGMISHKIRNEIK